MELHATVVDKQLSHLVREKDGAILYLSFVGETCLGFGF
jgi:hypothetical protein